MKNLFNYLFINFALFRLMKTLFLDDSMTAVMEYQKNMFWMKK